MKKPGAIWREILTNLIRKPFTVLYPKERLPIPPKFRGRPVFNTKGCIGCMLCVRDCPSDAIKIEKIAEKTFACTFYLDRCIYCGQCADSCPRKIIAMSQEYELSAFSIEPLRDTKRSELPAPTPASPETLSSSNT